MSCNNFSTLLKHFRDVRAASVAEHWRNTQDIKGLITGIKTVSFEAFKLLHSLSSSRFEKRIRKGPHGNCLRSKECTLQIKRLLKTTQGCDWNNIKRKANVCDFRFLPQQEIHIKCVLIVNNIHTACHTMSIGKLVCVCVCVFPDWPQTDRDSGGGEM